MKPALLLALLPLAACQSGGTTCKLYQVDTIPIIPSGKHLLAQVSVNSQPVSMIVDTGAALTMLTTDAAKRTEIAITSTFDTGAQGVGGRRHFDMGAARRIDIGTLHVPNAAMAVSDIALPTHADGLLGIDLLGRFDLDIDLVSRRLTMYEPDPACTKPSAAFDPPLYSVDLLPALPHDTRPRFIVEINGQAFTGLLDTGAATTMLFRPAAARLGLSAAPGQADVLSGIGENRVSSSRQVVKSLGIGDLEIDNLPIAVAEQDNVDPVDLLLGSDALTRIHFWISQSSRTLIMQAPPRASHSKPS